MFLRKKKTETTHTYDRETQKPVLKSSICTGEQVAGFKDIRTGKFQDICLIKTEADLEEFLKSYGIQREDLTKEW